ncbi:universal stress protein [Streptomyces sp. E11-3]|uniref:universal stress protein n=1 Tax=Streptomyces sp. E11-3 TaxID=3110112 RepID=UPI00398182F3
MIKAIVVGLDGSRESLAAADWAAREALRRGLPLRLVHAWEGLPNDEEPARLPELRVPQYWARRVVRGAMERLSERYPQVYISAEQIKRPPVPTLVSEAETAELLVLGNQGLGPLSGFFAGSVAMAALAQVRRPVVLVRAGCSEADEHLPLPDGRPGSRSRTPCRDVALAVDLRHECGPLFDFAFGAAQYRAAPLRVFHVWHLPSGHGGAERDGGAQAQRAVREEDELAAVLAPWREKFPTVVVRAQVVNGRPVHEVVEAARGAGLLVVGRQLRHTVVGSHTGRVAHMAIHHVSCPVAVVAHE